MFDTTRKSFVCKNVMPGLVCNFFEMDILGSLFLLTAVFSIYQIFIHLKSKKKFDKSLSFWFFLLIWQFFRGITSLVYFNYDMFTFSIVFIGFRRLIFFVPMCLVILILFELLFTYRNPGTNIIIIFRWFIGVFLGTFLTLSVILSKCETSIDYSDDFNDQSEPDLSLSFWGACSDLILCLFFAFPAIKLINVVTTPMVPPENAKCVNFTKIGIVVYILLFLGRSIYSATHFFNINLIQKFLNEQLNSNESANLISRLISFFYYFFFELVPTVMAQIAVVLITSHQIMFSENPYYTRDID
ncbi:hypothetical protein TRFO_03793 [Tritrichomonas foetus]|uniref:THH1/TOM1/TOM3 domain-containing protein n=1 Tax=Tritrichomonas foetus TaxID=1144522 RepID=A0A1J4KR46_9EUKA|nr:hypothetical protein TRFO_03793 [Tritrichomonas foetus]|eukprot:OHT12142.1 hypothetical protein TRFO_03793 [Tritrichomonas foetus]